MSIQVAGRDYLWSYSGILKSIEQILNTTIIIVGVLLEHNKKKYFLLSVAMYACLYSGILLILHLKGIIRKSTLPWFWIECVNALILLITYILSSSIAITVLTKGYIINGAFGCIAAMVYFLDTMDKYKLATTKRSRYVWTTPNMPE